jgi:CheY-like chemotaxis protein
MPQLILADKSDLFRRSITSVLQREGYEVLAAETGQRVLSLCQANTPDAVILDTETPDPSGLETLLLMKKDPKLRRLPVIVVSRDSAPSAVSNAFKVGAESFMLKPIDLNALIKALDSFKVPVPELNAEVRVVFGSRVFNGTLRFLDQYGMVYLDKVQNELEVAASQVWDPRTEEEKANSPNAIGLVGVMQFEAGDKKYHQRVMLSEENEQGVAVYPVGEPSQSETPEVLRVPVSYKARYMVQGSFMKLADVALLSGQALHLHGLQEEPRFNSAVQVTLYPQSGGAEGGIPLKGKITSAKPLGDAGYEIEVQLTEPPGLQYVNLMAELIGGRPAARASV